LKHETFTWRGNRGLQIFAQSWAPNANPLAVVALVHGLGEHSGRYQHVAEAFTQAGYAMLGFDLPGHGQSEGKRGHTSYDEAAGEIDHLLEEVERRWPRTGRFLYDHSLGGALMLYYLLRRKPSLNGAIVTSPGIAAGAPVPGWKRLAARSLSKLVPDFTMANGLDLANLSHDPQVIERYRQDPLVHDQISARLGWDLIENGRWILDHAAELTVPLLLMQGSGDRLVSLQATRLFAERAPADKITYKEWDQLYHETHNEPEKEQVIRCTLDWIAQHC